MSSVDLGYYKDNRVGLSEISNLLKELPLFSFYEKIEEELGKNVSNDKCNECNTKLTGTDQEVSQLLKLCKSFCNIILNVSDLNLHCRAPPCNISCTYMNLWLYSNVISITEKSNIIEKIYTALQTIRDNSRSDIKFCGIVKFQSNREQFKNFKYLYEFLFTYNIIKKKISPQRNKEDRLYCKHIKENFRFYNDIKENCTKSNICPYRGELGEIKNMFSDPTNLYEIYSRCNYVQTPCKPDSNESNDIPCLKEKESTFLSPIIDPNPDKTVNKIFNGLTYSIPTLATLTMLYKFTPLGSWLCSKIKRTNNMKKNINTENYHISHHNSRIEEIDPGNDSNNTY